MTTRNNMLAWSLALFVIAAVAPRSSAGDVTYSKDVAPIVFANCAGCHHPGEVAPFSLLTYKDAAKRADQLAEVTHSRFMPPWKAEPLEFGHTLEDQIGGQIDAGFVIAGFYEDRWPVHPLDGHLPLFIATKVVKPPN